MIAPPEAVAAARALPLGESRGTWDDAPWVCSKSSFAEGRTLKIVAERLGGTGYVSMNLYFLKHETRLYPWEMPAEKCIAFLQGFRPDTSRSGTQAPA